jgi:hypothetical protein
MVRDDDAMPRARVRAGGAAEPAAWYELPFNGFKDSGYGNDEVLEFTREKAVVIAMGGASAAGYNPFAGGAFSEENDRPRQERRRTLLDELYRPV